MADSPTTPDLRCSWCQGSDLYRQYHDTEWGVPCRDSVQLFELLNLEGQQAGLSWITILNKRNGYRRLFADFDPITIARFTDAKLDTIAVNTAIVRHRKKIEAIRTNARAWIASREAGQDLSDVVWAYVDNVPKDNSRVHLSEVPASSDVSTAMSKQLKKMGYVFVGPTTCYAFMQAAGLVNDHLTQCPRHSQVARH